MARRTGQARTKLLDAALAVVRTKGFAATTVDELCREAGVTKGAFFHHFRSKEALGVAAAEHWSTMTAGLFERSPYHDHADPLDRFVGYVRFRRELLAGELAEYTCLAGTMVQEVYASAPAIRDACRASIFGHAATLEADIAAAMSARGVDSRLSAESLAHHTQAVLQGAFILAKASGDVSIAEAMVDHLLRYIELLFAPNDQNGQNDQKENQDHEPTL